MDIFICRQEVTQIRRSRGNTLRDTHCYNVADVIQHRDHELRR